LLFAAAVLAVAMAVLVLWTPYQPEHPGGLPLYGDGGVHAYIGSRVLHGEVPLVTWWTDKPPGVFYVNALAFAIGGASVHSLQLLDLGSALVSVVAFFWVAVLLSRTWIAVLVTLAFTISARNPALLEGGNYTEQYALPLLIVALGCVLLSHRRSGRGAMAWAALAGVLLALGTLVSLLVLPVAVAAGASYFPFARQSVRAAARLLAGLALGFGAPMAFGLGYYAAIGGLPHVDDALTFTRLYTATSGRWGLLAGVAGIALVTALWARSPGFRPYPASPALLLGGGTALALLGHLASGHYFAHHLLAAVIPCGALLVTFALEMEVAHGQPPPAARVALATTGCAVVVGGSLLALALSDYRPDPATASFLWSNNLAPGALPKRIDELCPAGASVFVWGNQPSINFLADRKAASRYPDLFAVEMPGYDNARRVNEMAHDLQVSKPCAIVDTSAALPIVPPLDAARRATWVPSTEEGGIHSYADFQPVYDFVASHYAPSETVDAYTIWLRRPAVVTRPRTTAAAAQTPTIGTM